MSLTSPSFFVFFIIVFLACLLIEKHNEHKKTFLLLASYYFYMTIDWRFSFLLLALTLINYYSGYIIVKYKNQTVQKIALTSAIVASLSILFYFKYANFFLESVFHLLSFVSIKNEHPIIEVVLPVGISFMTFQAITYPLDLYKKKLNHQSSLKDFSFFMAFFPQLLSGPIVRASFFLPQLEHNEGFNDKNSIEGLALIIRGLIKKIIFADILAVQIVDPAFNSPELYSTIFLLIGLIAFSFQVYMDLGGYTDIALGVGKMLGYKLPINFNRPYLATSVANYWQRWHITMSSFFRDYLYEAIAPWKFCDVYTKLLIVFVAVGLWHGAGWNFVVYGLIHGSLVGLEHYRKSRRSMANKPPVVYRGIHYIIRVAQIFAIVSITRILFRSQNLAESITYLKAIFTSTVVQIPLSPIAALVLIIAMFLHFSPVRWRDQLMSYFIKMPVIISAGATTMIIYFLIALDSNKEAFLYFQF